MHTAALRSRTIFFACLGSGLVFFLTALLVGAAEHKTLAAMSLIGISLLFEAQPAAVASIPLGFRPVSGAVISVFANLMLIPLMMFAFDQIIQRWHWIRKKLSKAGKWADKYGTHGVWVLSPLAALIGGYLCVAISHGLRWNPVRSFISIAVGIVGSTFLITLAGHWLVQCFHHFF